MRAIFPATLLLACAIAHAEQAVPLKPFLAPRPAIPAAVPVRTGETHTVREGETLWSIARKHGRDPQLIRWMNRLGDGAALRPGQVIFVGSL